MNREPSVGSIPPNSGAPNLIVRCSNGGRHKSRELLRLRVMFDQSGRPMLSQQMSPQRGNDAPWTPIPVAERAPDGHQVINRKCPNCPIHFEMRADKLSAALAANPGECVDVDISGPAANLFK